MSEHRIRHYDTDHPLPPSNREALTQVLQTAIHRLQATKDAINEPRPLVTSDCDAMLTHLEEASRAITSARRLLGEDPATGDIWRESVGSARHLRRHSCSTCSEPGACGATLGEPNRFGVSGSQAQEDPPHGSTARAEEPGRRRARTARRQGHVREEGGRRPAQREERRPTAEGRGVRRRAPR